MRTLSFIIIFWQNSYVYIRCTNKLLHLGTIRGMKVHNDIFFCDSDKMHPYFLFVILLFTLLQTNGEIKKNWNCICILRYTVEVIYCFKVYVDSLVHINQLSTITGPSQNQSKYFSNLLKVCYPEQIFWVSVMSL